MKISKYSIQLLMLLCIIGTGCVTKKKRGETTKFGKFYHNTTSYYNGYWNATELLRLNMINMRQSNVDDYNKVLEVEDFVNLANPKTIEADMNKAIEKVIVVSNVHEEGDWVDDSYVLMAKAQYFKQDYETAETTLQYFQEVFNPKNPYGRNYYKSPYNKKKLKKLQEKQKEEEKKLKQKEKEEKQEQKEASAKAKEKSRKEKAREKEKERKQRAKEREKARKNKTKVAPGTEKNQSQGTGTIPPVTPEIKKESSTNPATEEKKEKEAIKKPEEDKTAYNEGLLWLAKTYIKRQNYFTAEFLLQKLISTGNIQKHVVKEIPATLASLYIKQKKYDEALTHLKDAIEITRDKELKARYSYIIGQISEKQNNYAGARDYYKIAQKKSKNPQMVMMASMAILKNENLSGKRSKEQTIVSLDKMLKEEKYSDQKHVIYYTMGQVELTNKNLDKAIEYFQLSLLNNASDDKMKTDVYFLVASELYKEDKFLEAKLYYDSTQLVMNKNDVRFAEVEKRAKNLVDIAKNIATIQHHDTLLYLSELTGADQKKAITAYLKNKIKEKPQKDPAENKLNQPLVNISANKFTEDFGNSNFFAYNKTSKDKGKEEFVKKWGRSIQLQDNWRLSSRAKEVSDNQDVARNETLNEKQKEKELEESAEYKNLLKEIPQSPVQKKEVQERLINAMFSLGKLYRTVLEKFSNSNEVLEKMHTRFGPTQHELESYYHLVLNYRDLNETSKANEYADKLIRKYPESTYAKILSDPTYFESAKAEAGKIDLYYEETYRQFTSGNYKIVLERIKVLKEQYGEENKYAAKIALIYAMCVGSTEGKDAYVKSLNDVIIAFPNTQEQVKARETLRFLTGDIQAFSTINEEEAAKLYAFDETKPHFVVIVTYGLSEMQFVDVKIAISEFNKKHYKLEKLQLSDAMLNKTDNSQIVVVKKFANARESMKYFEKVNQLKAEFITGNINYEVLPISQPNYLKMLGQYSSSAYRYFFEENYKNLK